MRVNTMTKDNTFEDIKNVMAFIMAVGMFLFMVAIYRGTDKIIAENEHLRQEVIELRQEVKRLDDKTEPERMQNDYFEWLKGRK